MSIKKVNNRVIINLLSARGLVHRLFLGTYGSHKLVILSRWQKKLRLTNFQIVWKFSSGLLHFRIIVQRTKNGNLEIFDHPARIALDMATTRKGKKRSATEMVYICSSIWLLNHVIYLHLRWKISCQTWVGFIYTFSSSLSCSSSLSE